MAKLAAEQILEAIDNMTVIELNELVKALQEKYGVTAVVPVVGGEAAATPTPQPEVVAEEEKATFDVILNTAGDQRLQVIKVVRALTNLGLKEAKELVEKAPQPVVHGVSKEEAERVKAKLEEVGAQVELK